MGLELLTQATLITRARAVIGNRRALANVVRGNHVWQVWRHCLGDICTICIKQKTDEHFDLCGKVDLESLFCFVFFFFFNKICLPKSANSWVGEVVLKCCTAPSVSSSTSLMLGVEAANDGGLWSLTGSSSLPLTPGTFLLRGGTGKAARVGILCK